MIDEYEEHDPTTIEECDEIISEIQDEIDDIESQIDLYNTGRLNNRDEAWLRGALYADQCRRSEIKRLERLKTSLGWEGVSISEHIALKKKLIDVTEKYEAKIAQMSEARKRDKKLKSIEVNRQSSKASIFRKTLEENAPQAMAAAYKLVEQSEAEYDDMKAAIKSATT